MFDFIVLFFSDTAPVVRTTTTTDGNRDTTQPSKISSPKTGKFIDILFVILYYIYVLINIFSITLSIITSPNLLYFNVLCTLSRDQAPYLLTKITPLLSKQKPNQQHPPPQKKAKRGNKPTIKQKHPTKKHSTKVDLS